MKITLLVAGGLAPPLMGRQYVVDSADLDAATQLGLAELVETALQDSPQKPNESARDVRSYEIRIDSESASKTIVTFDGSMHPTARRLIEMITSIARSDRKP